LPVPSGSQQGAVGASDQPDDFDDSSMDSMSFVSAESDDSGNSAAGDAVPEVFILYNFEKIIPLYYQKEFQIQIFHFWQSIQE
jgi:hypothetical protein